MSDLHVDPILVYDFEHLLLDLGTWGLYQTVISILLFTPIVFVSSTVFFNLIDLSSDNEHQQTDWSHLVFLGGIAISPFLTFWLAKMVGRKYTFLAAVTCLGSCGIWIAFSNSFNIILASKFICGVGCFGVLYPAILHHLEIVGIKYAHITGILFVLALALGQVYLGFILNQVQNNIQMVWCWSCGPILGFLANWLILPHSYRWLIATGQIDEAQNQMNWIAKWNNKPQRSMMEYTQQFQDQTFDATYTWCHALIYSLCSITCGALVSGIVRNVPKVTGSIGMDLGILAISDILATFLHLAFGSKRAIEYIYAALILMAGIFWTVFQIIFENKSWSFIVLFSSRISLVLAEINLIHLVGVRFPIDDWSFLVVLEFGFLGSGLSATTHIFLPANVETIIIGITCFMSAVMLSLMSLKCWDFKI